MRYLLSSVSSVRTSDTSSVQHTGELGLQDFFDCCLSPVRAGVVAGVQTFWRPPYAQEECDS